MNLRKSGYYYKISIIKIHRGRDFAGGPVIKNPPYNAQEVGSIPGRGTKIPHVAGQLSPHTTTRERKKPMHHN